MSMAHVRAYSWWSRSRISSVKPCSPPSGMAIRRTGRSRLDSQVAALIRWAMWSRFHRISSRWRMPRMVGISPTTWYGSITPRLLDRSAPQTLKARGALGCLGHGHGSVGSLPARRPPGRLLAQPASGASVRPATIAASFEVLVDLAPLPLRSEQTAKTEQANSRNDHGEPGAEHWPVEPQAGRIVEHVDREPHEAERQVDGHDRGEDPLATNPAARLSPRAIPIRRGRLHWVGGLLVAGVARLGHRSSRHTGGTCLDSALPRRGPRRLAADPVEGGVHADRTNVQAGWRRASAGQGPQV